MVSFGGTLKLNGSKKRQVSPKVHGMEEPTAPEKPAASGPPSLYSSQVCTALEKKDSETLQKMLAPDLGEKSHEEIWKGVAKFLSQKGYREEMDAIRENHDNTPDATQLQLLGAAASHEAKQPGHGKEYYYIKNWALLQAGERGAECSRFVDRGDQEIIALRTQGNRQYRGIVTVHHVDQQPGMVDRKELQAGDWQYTAEWQKCQGQDVAQGNALAMLRSQLGLEDRSLYENKIREAAPCEQTLGVDDGMRDRTQEKNNPGR